MQEESKNKLLELLINSDINNIDKLELLINIKLFLEDYEENIKILQRKERKK